MRTFILRIVLIENAAVHWSLRQVFLNILPAWKILAGFSTFIQHRIRAGHAHIDPEAVN